VSFHRGKLAGPSRAAVAAVSQTCDSLCLAGAEESVFDRCL
jgi:hypothetical protein